MTKKIERPFWPVFDEEHIAAAEAVLRSGAVNYWTGEQGKLFEEEYAKSLNVKHAIALANGTVALELALAAAGVGKGDEVVVTPRSFIASASCIVGQNATPVFADVDQYSQNITVETIRSVVTAKTKAIITVHLNGWPCEMDPIIAFARERGILIIEDCAQAHGAMYKGRPVGSLGDIAAFSFCQDKIISTGGEGGLLATNNTEYWRRAWKIKDHGKPPEIYYNREPPGDTYRWVHEVCGTNMRMTEMQAAIGRISLKKLPIWIRQRREVAEKIARALAGIPSVRVPKPPEHCDHAWYRFYIFLDPEKLSPRWTRGKILASLRENGVPCNGGVCGELYKEAALSEYWSRREPLPVAELLGRTSLAIALCPNWCGEYQDAIVGLLTKTLRAAFLTDHPKAA